MPQINAYRITSIKALRRVLRSFQDLEGSSFETVTILLDLRRAMGDDPNSPSALTRRQRQVVQVHLIECRSGPEAAKILGIDERVVRHRATTALKNILRYLNEGWVNPNNMWRGWMLKLLRDENLSVPEIAKKIGISEGAVRAKMTRMRRVEPIPFRRAGRPYTRKRAAK